MTNPYCQRWNALQRGRAAEMLVRSALLEAAYALTREHGVRINTFVADLDIDLLDLSIRLESLMFSTYIEVSVRSSSGGGLALGQPNEYGSIAYAMARSVRCGVPLLVFFFDWRTRSLGLLSNKDYAALTLSGTRRWIPSREIPTVDVSALQELFLKLAKKRNATEAKACLM